uniref:Tail fiber protein n=1 Tax=Lygus hesperus TaxID=30085 RepID=A0A0A9XSQ8_LYGHE
MDSSLTEEVEVEDNLLYIYLAAALWVLILYVTGISMWIYLQVMDSDLDQVFHRTFMERHCKDQPQLPSPSQIARFTLDGSIDFNIPFNIPAEAFSVPSNGSTGIQRKVLVTDYKNGT